MPCWVSVSEDTNEGLLGIKRSTQRYEGSLEELCPAFRNLENICWQTTFYATLWTIWTCRNEVIFNNKTWEVEEITDLVKTRLAIWIKGKFNIKIYTVEDFKWNLESVRKLRLVSNL